MPGSSSGLGADLGVMEAGPASSRTGSGKVRHRGHLWVAPARGDRTNAIDPTVEVSGPYTLRRELRKRVEGLNWLSITAADFRAAPPAQRRGHPAVGPISA
ncbi:MAG: hypothetical protein ACYDC5_08025 [Candidatus Dormibacteria bacterium]